MANELTLTGSLAYEDAELADIVLAITAKKANVSTKKFIHAKQSIGTSEEAIGLGEVTSLGYAVFVNRDSTNYLEVRLASGASNDHIKVSPGLFAIFQFGSDVTAPYAIANTAAVQLEYLIVSV